MIRRKEFRKKIKKIEFKLCPRCYNNYKLGKIVFDKGFKVKKAYALKVCEMGCGKKETKYNKKQRFFRIFRKFYKFPIYF